MVNHNGNLIETKDVFELSENRGYKYGDALFETLKVVNGKVFFWEDHYFRLMASMRILRMDIPMKFTMDFLEAEILKTLYANDLLKTSARVRLNIDRGMGGKYKPDAFSLVSFNITAEPLANPFYTIDENIHYIVDLYKDFYVAPGLLSGLKSNNKVINVIGSIYAAENDLNNCLLLNTDKQVVEALNGNLFLVTGNTVKTPPLQDGCLKGVMRKQILNALKNNPNYVVQEESISPFELQKADELFVTNVIKGIQPVSQYRKKKFTTTVAKEILQLLNAKLRLEA